LIHLNLIDLVSRCTRVRLLKRRPAVNVAAALALVVFACCFARSDAQIAAVKAVHFDAGQVVGNWNGPRSNGAVVLLDDARTSGIVASAQSLLTSPKIDGDLGDPVRVTPLLVDGIVEERRVFDIAAPDVRFSSYLAPGKRRMVSAGARGVEWLTERVTYWNDVEVGRQILSRQIVRRPVPAVVLEGMPTTLAELQRSAHYASISAAMTFVATAYTADTASANPTGYTATGVLAHRGIVAVDPRVIPLGTLLFVPGYGVGVAADTGGAIIGNRIDLCMDSYGDAMTFGRRTVQVYVLKR
jgi:3D (Asp-Asp-Asp) domain-containing protein